MLALEMHRCRVLRAREKEVGTSGPDVEDELPPTARDREVFEVGQPRVASVSAGADQPEGARRGGKEAAEVACAERDEGASEDQAPEEDLARQVETRHACPAALRAVACTPPSLRHPAPTPWV
jgi:hypothetical protein